jgi:hypothetical protein
MSATWSRFIALVAVCLLIPVTTRASDDSVIAAKELPKIFENGTITISGYGGTPGDRSTFKIELDANGNLSEQLGRKKLEVPIRKVKLSPEKTQQFYEAMVKAVTETDPKILNGGVCDGSYVSVTIKSNAVERHQRYNKVDSLPLISPHFKVIYDTVKNQTSNDDEPR